MTKEILKMSDQAFLNNAQAVLMITADEWTKTFVKSLIDQVRAGRVLTEKQINLFNKKLDGVMNPTPPVNIDPEFFSKIEALKKKTKSEWLLSFLKSIENQMQLGKVLTEKQISIFNAKYDRLVLKIKPAKTEIEVDPEYEGIIDESDTF